LLDQVWLGIAESVNATFKQKLAAVEVFGMICINPEMPVAIFFNYDCAKDDRCDLFSRIIRFLERVLKHKQEDRGNEFISSAQDQALKRASTHVFVMIMQRISTWVEAALRTNCNPETPKKGGNLEKANTEAASKFMENYAERQREKQTIQDGIVKFNMNPKKGMKWLINMGLVEDTVVSRVNFLLNNTLDKGQIGEYLGLGIETGEEMNLYINSIDFSGCTIDEGLRRLSYQFRLPGEGQKIDRIMQKFAERYCLQNPNIFAEADDAYVLAYSTIMLNVTLHNPKVKDQMTMESFVKVNKTIIDSPAMEDGRGEELLEGIFERIKANEILLEKPKNVEEETRSSISRYRSFVLERKAIIENVNSEVLLSRVNARQGRIRGSQLVSILLL
jgi:Sec7-like guanine-nucleotide exchange factor